MQRLVQLLSQHLYSSSQVRQFVQPVAFSILQGCLCSSTVLTNPAAVSHPLIQWSPAWTHTLATKKIPIGLGFSADL